MLSLAERSAPKIVEMLVCHMYDCVRACCLLFLLSFHNPTSQPRRETWKNPRKNNTTDLNPSIYLKKARFSSFQLFLVGGFPRVFCAVRNTRKNRENRKQQYSVAKYDQNMEHKKIQTLKITTENPLWRFVCLLLFRSCTMRSSRFCACLSGMYEKNSEPESNESNSRTRRTQA